MPPHHGASSSNLCCPRNGKQARGTAGLIGCAPNVASHATVPTHGKAMRSACSPDTGQTRRRTLRVGASGWRAWCIRIGTHSGLPDSRFAGRPCAAFFSFTASGPAGMQGGRIACHAAISVVFGPRCNPFPYVSLLRRSLRIRVRRTRTRHVHGLRAPPSPFACSPQASSRPTHRTRPRASTRWWSPHRAPSSGSMMCCLRPR